jgi:hypothetical protein
MYKVIDSKGNTKYLYYKDTPEYEAVVKELKYEDKIVLMVSIDKDNKALIVEYDNSLELDNMWPFQTDKFNKQVFLSTKYYRIGSTNTELPFTAVGYENRVITERYITGEITPSGSKINELEGIYFRKELEAFSKRYNIDLPPHNIEDLSIFSVSVDYDKNTPTNIIYHIEN